MENIIMNDSMQHPDFLTKDQIEGYIRELPAWTNGLRLIVVENHEIIGSIDGVGCNYKDGYAYVSLKRATTAIIPALDPNHLPAPEPQEVAKAVDRAKKLLGDMKIRTCVSCGYEWLTGHDGSHHCVGRLQEQARELKEKLLERDNALRWTLSYDQLPNHIKKMLSKHADIQMDESGGALMATLRYIASLYEVEITEVKVLE